MNLFDFLIGYDCLLKFVFDLCILNKYTDSGNSQSTSSQHVATCRSAISTIHDYDNNCDYDNLCPKTNTLMKYFALCLATASSFCNIFFK